MDKGILFLLKEYKTYLQSPGNVDNKSDRWYPTGIREGPMEHRFSSSSTSPPSSEEDLSCRC
jgi:hypothetical protein